MPELANVKHVSIKAAARLNNAQRTATNRRANASVARAAFPTRNPHRNRSRASGRSGNISRSSGICCALHSIANNSRRDSLRGAKSPKSPETRPTLSERCPFLPSFRLSLDKLTKPSGVLRVDSRSAGIAPGTVDYRRAGNGSTGVTWARREKKSSREVAKSSNRATSRWKAGAWQMRQN
jgi:hypothetical protein